MVVGFVGVGIMGKGMLLNLVTKMGADTEFLVWNRSKDVVNAIASDHSNVKVAGSAKEVVERCDVTYCMLSTIDASIAVFDSEDGVVAGVSAGKTIVDCATLTPERMADAAGRIKAKGGAFLEAPVSGSKVPAEKGLLIFLCGGDEATFSAVKPALDMMGKASFLFGDVGQGSRVKLIVNMLMGTMLTAFGESMALCDGAGLPQDKLLEVLSLGVMANQMFALKGPSMMKDEHPTHFPLKHAQKDMRFAIAMADELGVSLPTSASANESFKRARVEHGEEDFSAVYSVLKKPKS